MSVWSHVRIQAAGAAVTHMGMIAELWQHDDHTALCLQHSDHGKGLIGRKVHSGIIALANNHLQECPWASWIHQSLSASTKLIVNVFVYARNCALLLSTKVTAGKWSLIAKCFILKALHIFKSPLVNMLSCKKSKTPAVLRWHCHRKNNNVWLERRLRRKKIAKHQSLSQRHCRWNSCHPGSQHGTAGGCSHRLWWLVWELWTEMHEERSLRGGGSSCSHLCLFCIFKCLEKWIGTFKCKCEKVNKYQILNLAVLQLSLADKLKCAI